MATYYKTQAPIFVFQREHDIELEAGLILAGMLVVDLPKHGTVKRRHTQMVDDIVYNLLDALRSGQMSNDAIIFGWPGNERPANAIDIDNDEVMAAWASDRLLFELRIDPRRPPSVQRH